MQNTTLKAPPASSLDVIDKNEFLAEVDQSESHEASIVDGKKDDYEESLWYPRQLRPPPAFYPMEKSTRVVEGSAPEVALRISECLRTLSVQASYNNELATANLLTAENVEMHLSLWQTPFGATPEGVMVELQRRKGDSIAFHRYSRTILDAAVAEGEEGVQPLDDMLYSKRAQRLLSTELQNQELEEHENAVIAIEIAHSLLMKDRVDATQLGLESLCLLTDPKKTGYVTAVITAHVVLLGSIHAIQIPGVSADEGETAILMNEGPFQEIRSAILNLVQFQRIGDGDGDLDEMDQSEQMDIDKEHMTILHNLALAVLANSLDVLENYEQYNHEQHDNEPEDTKPRARLRTSSTNDVADEFISKSHEISSKDILSTLISELGNARNKPHNATLSAKCIGSLCRASEEARKRAKELGAKQVVATALDVGVRTHLKLETECKKVKAALSENPRIDP